MGVFSAEIPLCGVQYVGLLPLYPLNFKIIVPNNIRPCLDCGSKGTFQSHSGSISRVYSILFYYTYLMSQLSAFLEQRMPQ
jgi:hypothetical protein